MHAQRLARFAALLLVGLSAAGCVNRLSANVSPNANLTQRQHVHIVKHAADSNEVNELVKARLEKAGFHATTALEGAPIPEGTEIVVVYTDKWMWDITMYMMELTITFRNPENDFPVASGNAFHGSLTRRSPVEMVDEVISEILKSGGGA